MKKMTNSFPGIGIRLFTLLKVIVIDSCKTNREETNE